MKAAFVEHRPKSDDPNAETDYFVIVVNGIAFGHFPTQRMAIDRACAQGYRPVHTARVRHLQDRHRPDHWREEDC